MLSDGYQTMMSDAVIRPVVKNPDYGEDLRRQQEENEREKELARLRSGSAPPTVVGSLKAFEGLYNNGCGSPAGYGDFGIEEKLRVDPSYVNYYYSNANMNPRLPPPLVSKEDWRFMQQRLNGDSGSMLVGRIGDRRRVNDGRCDDDSMFSMQAVGSVRFDGKEDVKQRKSGGIEWGSTTDDGFIGFPASGLGTRQRSIADIFQGETNGAASASKQHLHGSNVFDDIAEKSETHFGYLHQDLDDLRTGGNKQGISTAQNLFGSVSQDYASVLVATLSRSSTPDAQLLSRASSPCLPPIGEGRSSAMDKRSSNGQNSFNAVPSNLNETTDLVSALASMTLSQNDAIDDEKRPQSPRHNESDYAHNARQQCYLNKPDSFPCQHHFANHDLNNSSLYANKLKGQSRPTFAGRGSSRAHYQNVDYMNMPHPNHGITEHAINPSSPPMMASQIGSGYLPLFFEHTDAQSLLGMNAMESRGLGRVSTFRPSLAASELSNASMPGNHAEGSAHQLPLMDLLYPQYLRSSEVTAAHIGALNESASNRDCTNNSFTDLIGFQKAYIDSLTATQKAHFSVPYLGKSASLNHNYYGNPSYDLGMSYRGSPLAGSPSNSPYGLGSPMSQNELNRRLSGMRNVVGGFTGAWHSDTASSLVEEFKSNKTRCFELSEIAGHVVEFSADQYGSRFIQQKLETASMEEKNMVFHEIIPQALSLMTDVFGNYVIQKFFEHGTAAQIRELADQVSGHVLTLSLQMYGCRVIQKAIEVVTLDQKTEMVNELDGHIMRCVRDQNGNHVIQKCIECVPENVIHFIVSTFFGQVVALSTHPYGCRVIQRVLEYCHVPKTQQVMMDEILGSVCMLAQNQYGNYVVQHVLEHGKPHERSAIIKELTGQVVQMSQQKFASNVIEKCLSFGTPTERQLLVNEMLGSTDENEPLQAMMKDQFANYVVQKVLESCDDQQLELILNRIKVHLNALNKYTYGKHIVARLEKLVATGERRISSLILNPAQMAEEDA